MHSLHDKLKHILLLGIASALLFSCQKGVQHFDNPYTGGKQPFGIHLSTDLPSPEEGGLGSTVTFKATGLLPFKSSLSFYLNSEKCQVTAIDSNSIQIKVPQTASTGVASVVVGDQIFFGPVFRVSGKLAIDNNFKATVGANRSIQDYLPLSSGRIILVGSFSDFNHQGAVKPLNRIVQISKDGDVIRTLKTGIAADGNLTSIAQLPNGKMVIGGAFSSFDTHQGEIRNISLLNRDGSLDTMVIRTFSDLDTVPAFNGGTDGNITRLFVTGNQITAVGNFRYYLQQVFKHYSTGGGTLDIRTTDSVEVRNVIRFFPDGSLDSSFNYNFYQHKSREGTNGPISDAYMQDDGKLLMVGNFTRYDGENVGYIVRINADGSIDRSFKAGNGADNAIASVRYNKVTHHYILAGGFRHFNGETHSGMVMLNEDGSVVESFKPSEMGSNDFYSFAQQLSNGLILVNGYFKTYAGVHRGNFMVLDPTGQLAPGYNTTGSLNGFISKAYETKNSAGQTTVMLMGGFGMFDEQSMGNITRVVLKQ